MATTALLKRMWVRWAVLLPALLLGLVLTIPGRATAQTVPAKFLRYLVDDGWQYYHVRDFDVDQAGNLYVLQYKDANPTTGRQMRVAKFLPDGTFDRAFGQLGSDPGDFPDSNHWDKAGWWGGDINLFRISHIDGN